MTRTIGNVARFSCMGVLLLTLLSLSSLTTLARENTHQWIQSVVILKHAPNGNARLSWIPQGSTLTVTIKLEGLQANTHHPAHIHVGSCPADNPILYKLNDIVADAAGNGTSTTTISGVINGIPASSWHINVHSGPTLNTAAQALPVTCGNVVNPQTSTASPQAVKVDLERVDQPNQNAMGESTLTVDQNGLTIRTIAHNLVPGSSHALHIHSGSCEVQLPGSILYHLNPVVADANGVGSSTAVIKGVSTIPTTGWYINLHFSTDLSTQTGYDVIDCGNVTG